MNNFREPSEFMTIGVINFGNFGINEQTVGISHFGKGIGNCKIQVFNNEGSIPHFHITNESKNFSCCVCIYEPLYFNHGKHQDKLDSTNRKKLQKWLQSPCQKKSVNGKLTNWEYISSCWDSLENNMNEVPKRPMQPDYSNMENMKG